MTSSTHDTAHTVFLPFYKVVSNIQYRRLRQPTLPACSFRFFSRALSRWLPRAILSTCLSESRKVWCLVFACSAAVEIEGQEGKRRRKALKAALFAGS
jgi:hypothetical protein